MNFFLLLQVGAIESGLHKTNLRSFFSLLFVLNLPPLLLLFSFGFFLKIPLCIMYVLCVVSCRPLCAGSAVPRNWTEPNRPQRISAFHYMHFFYFRGFISSVLSFCISLSHGMHTRIKQNGSWFWIKNAALWAFPPHFFLFFFFRGMANWWHILFCGDGWCTRARQRRRWQSVGSSFQLWRKTWPILNIELGWLVVRIFLLPILLHLKSALVQLTYCEGWQGFGVKWMVVVVVVVVAGAKCSLSMIEVLARAEVWCVSLSYPNMVISLCLNITWHIHNSTWAIIDSFLFGKDDNMDQVTKSGKEAATQDIFVHLTDF